MARRYLKVVGLLVVLVSVLAVTVVAAQAKAGTGLGMSMLKLVAGHEEEVRMSEAATSGMMFGKGRLMSRGEQDTDATCGAGEGEKMDCGAEGMSPTCGVDMSCGFEAEAGESAAPEAAPDSIPAE